jgi:hypothetical protein
MKLELFFLRNFPRLAWWLNISEHGPMRAPRLKEQLGRKGPNAVR